MVAALGLYVHGWGWLFTTCFVSLLLCSVLNCLDGLLPGWWVACVVIMGLILWL